MTVRPTWRWFFALTAALLAVPVPCAARGTGGFLRGWAVCGPLAEARLDAGDLPDDFVAYPGRLGPAGVWLPVEAETRGRINLRDLYPEAEKGTALLHTFFKAPEGGVYHLRIGSDDAVRVDLDGRCIHRRDVRRAWRADQDTVRVRLTAGWHRLLLRVVDYGGEWAASVRVAGAADQAIDVPHQARCPPDLAETCGLEERVTLAERAEVAKFLTGEVASLHEDLRAAVPPLETIPEGYVAFAEYQTARDLARRFFEAVGALWEEAVGESPNAERIRALQHQAGEAARGFSEVLALETDQLASDLLAHPGVWRRLGSESLRRRDLAEVAVRLARLVARTRSLAERIESERLLTARFENDIRNFRQRDLTVCVREAGGRPVAEAVVEIRQQAHDFLFGCNLFAFGRWGKRNALYQRRFERLFNLGVVPVYWSVIERQQGRAAYGRVDAAVRWCRKKGIRVRAHPLLWQDAVPRWADGLAPDALAEALRAHLRRTVERYSGTVAWWDVVHGPAETVRVGKADIRPADVLAWTASAEPRGHLLVTADDPASLAPAVRRAEEEGVSVAGVGLTAHQHDGAWSFEQIRRRVRQAAEADRPVHISAVTIPGDPETEAEQAEAVRHFYTAAFANADVASITWWDLSDRFAWRNAPAGLLRADLSPKPAYHVLDELINRRWRTEAAGQTDADGCVRARVFFGTYRISARAGDRKVTRTVHLGRGGPARVEVQLPAPKK